MQRRWEHSADENQYKQCDAEVQEQNPGADFIDRVTLFQVEIRFCFSSGHREIQIPEKRQQVFPPLCNVSSVLEDHGAGRAIRLPWPGLWKEGRSARYPMGG